MFRPLFLAAGFSLILASGPAVADETSDKQKQAAQESLKKADVTGTTQAETANLLVFATLPEEKTRALAATLQKAYTTAARALQYDDKDSPWKGKLAVIYLTDRKLFNLYVRSTANEKPDGTTFVAVRGDEPWVAMAVEAGPKASDAQLFGDAAETVAAAMIVSKAGAGATLPEWVKYGFARAAVLRSGGPSNPKLAAYKAQARKVGTRPIASIWDGSGKDTEVLATALMDFLAYAPKADLPRVVSGFRPNENNASPSPAQALEAGGWEAKALDPAFKKWLAAGLPEGKLPPPKP